MAPAVIMGIDASLYSPAETSTTVPRDISRITDVVSCG
jgi:hypothetical protein